MFALDEYPAVKLAEAREKCKQVADGVSPTQARQLDKIRKVNNASNTFELIAKEWLQMKYWAEMTQTRRLDMLERVVFPTIGKLPIREITPHHILKILQGTAKRGTPTVAAEVRRTISSVFELAGSDAQSR
ncbi:Putative prophage CPS-53 integrase [Serratia plymuthica]|nr:Putative prophage CPS-53 integrase [Serratia plymuthica]